MRALVRDLNRLYREQPALHQVDFQPTGFSWIDCDDAAHSVISLLRRSEHGRDEVLAIFNFTPIVREGYRMGVPEPGRYRELINTDAEVYGGGNVGNAGCARHRADRGAGHGAVAGADAATARRPDPEARLTDARRAVREVHSSSPRSSRSWRSSRATPSPARGRPPGRGSGAASRIADYDIASASTPTRSASNGRLRLTWRNPSADSVPDLWFHLYLNAFRDRESTFWRESGGQLRGLRDARGRLGLDRRHGAADRQRRRPPAVADVRGAGRWQRRGPHRGARPAADAGRAGRAIDLEIAFTATLPKAYARTGYAGDYFLVGQWFPKLAVYEPAGVRGRADRRLERAPVPRQLGVLRRLRALPRRHHGAAPLRRRRDRRRAVARADRGDGTTTHTYEQADVHDFAWTASPRFVEITRRFDAAARGVGAGLRATAAARLDRPVEELRLSDVEVRLLMQPEHLPQAERYLRATMRAIADFGLAYGRYPYRTLTIVDPPGGAIGTGGMEYPTFITAGTLAAFNAWPLDRVYRRRIVVVHEFAHQYFQGLVASNEFEEAWLDEGITEWATGWLVDEIDRPRSIGRSSWPACASATSTTSASPDHRGRSGEMIRQPSWYVPTPATRFNAYGRPSLTLRTLEGLLGRRTMARVMRTYVERWRFGHPSSDDFYRVASEVAGRDLTPFFRQTIESPAVIDYAVGEITQENAYTAVTVRRRATCRSRSSWRSSSPAVPSSAAPGTASARWTRFTFGYAEPLEWVDVDPDRKSCPRRLVAEQRARGALPIAAPRSAMTSRWLLAVQQFLLMARLLATRVSGGRAMREGLARLWTRAAFAVVATWAIVTIVAIVAVAPAWAWWSARARPRDRRGPGCSARRTWRRWSKCCASRRSAPAPSPSRPSPAPRSRCS